MSSSASHRLGLVPCPLCKNGPNRRTCLACEKAGMMPVDKAIATGLALGDTERELRAIHDEENDEEETKP